MTTDESTNGPRFEPGRGHSRGFLKGLFGGVLIGTGAGVLFAPQISAAVRHLRRQLADAAVDTGDTADFQQKGRGVYERALGVVAPEANAVPERAPAAQPEPARSTLDATRRAP
jgi:hypothetical protein